jgi:polar amino acid transport system permease protein
MNLDLLARYGPRMVDGLIVTVELSALAFLLGAVIAVPAALARLSSSRLLRAISLGYVYFFRGTPLLAQLFLVYYGSGQFRPFLESIGLWWLFRDAFLCCVLTFSLNTGAYEAESLRGAIKAVPLGQWEAAMSLGLPPGLVFRKIILPQALIVALRPLGNDLILTIKGSALAAVVTVFDLMGATRLAFARSFDISVYFWAAVLYLLLVETVRRLWETIEVRLTRHLAMRQTAPAT